MDGIAEESDNDGAILEKKTKKRAIHGRIKEVSQKLRLRSHELGSECTCKRLNCSSKIPPLVKQQILRNFNNLSSVNEQNLYLCGLMSLVPVRRRRPRKNENEASLRDCVVTYKVRYLHDNVTVEENVCRQEFIALHGITKNKIEHLVKSIKETGIAPKDKRGSHANRPKKLPLHTTQNIKNHISSFKGRSSHYSTKDTTKTYLPEELNLKKMFSMFKEKYPDCSVSYESYRTIFTKQFNISFGYPRTDTCSICDIFLAKLKCLEKDLEKPENKQKENILKATIRRLRTENDLHKKRAETFYSRKRKSKAASRQDTKTEAICMDYGKNLPLPNINTNDVYYKRQLSMYLFNIHTLSTSESVFYVYPENIGKKGSDDVTSLLMNFLYDHLDWQVRNLHIFCDSCGGQNKNYTVFRFLHHVVHEQKRLDSVKVTFPIRGHSYMETDKNMGIIKHKNRYETLDELCDLVQSARIKPSPFVVTKIDTTNQYIFRQWTNQLSRLYRKKCPFPIREIKEFEVLVQHPRTIRYRNTYNGLWETAVIKDKIDKNKENLKASEFILPERSYDGKLYEPIIIVILLMYTLFSDLINISAEKYADLQCLKQFCGPDAQEYLSNLPHN